MLKVENIYLTYTKQYYILHDLSLSLKPNQQITILGKQDSGKSSLGRVLVGLDKCEKGKIFYKDIPIEKIDFSTDISVGYIPSVCALFENKTVIKNLEYILKIRKINKENIEIKVINAINNFDLNKIKFKKIKELSNFEKIKVILARLSLRAIELFIVDDIFLNLQENEQTEICNLLKKLIKSNDAAAIILCQDEKIAKIFNYDIRKIEYGTLG